ncbi:MAG: hypothetical protein LBD01_02570, partial [Puniceicoccales bacterium]|nr:hypothetical protein [Puniceicoccales bacterium]
MSTMRNARVLQKDANADIGLAQHSKSVFLRLPTLFAAALFTASAVPTVKAANIAAGTNLRNTVNNLTSSSDKTLNLAGNVNWSGGGITYDSAKSGAVINGNSYEINFANGHGSVNASGTVALSLYNVKAKGYSGSDQDPFLFVPAGSNFTINVEGSTVSGFRTSRDGTTPSGAVASAPTATSTVTIDGGTNGAVFSSNVGYNRSGGALGLGEGTMYLKGKLTFSNNWAEHFGGAMMLRGSGSASLVLSDGLKVFEGNQALVYGGAIDIWGYNSQTTFNCESVFRNNYVYNPGTNTYANSRRAGAINIGDQLGTVSLVFNAPAKFEGNRVIGENLNGDRGDALGGAITAYSAQTGAYHYTVQFNAGVAFTDNYAHSLHASRVGRGGAIYYNAGGANLTIGPNSLFENNYAKTEGGAIYLNAGTINLTADSAVSGTQNGNIVFRGNYQGVAFAQAGNAWTYSATNLTSGATRNAVYLAGGGTFNVDAKGSGKVEFYDPIATSGSSTATINKNGTGDLIFHNYSSTPTITTNVNRGRLMLKNDLSNASMIEFGTTAGGTLTVGNGTGPAEIVGGTGTRFRANRLVLNSQGRIIVEDDSLLIARVGNGGLTVNNGAGIGGHGTVRLENASGNSIAVTTGSSGNNFFITTNNALDLFQLESDEYTILTGISGAGKLHKEGPGAFYANGFVFSTYKTGRNKNTHSGGTSIWDGAIVITDLGEGDPLAKKSTFSLGTGAIDVNAGYRNASDVDSNARGRLVVQFAPIDINGTYTINNQIKTSTAAGGEVYVDLAKASQGPLYAPWQNTLVIENINQFKGDLRLLNLQYTLTAGSGIAALTNANLIVDSESFVTVPSSSGGATEMSGLSLAGGFLYFPDIDYQSPVGTLFSRTSSFINATAASPRGVLALGTSGINPQSYIRFEAAEDQLRDLIEDNSGQSYVTPLLLQDDYGTMRQFVQARQVTGDVSNLVLQVKNGTSAYKNYTYTPSTQDGKVDHNQGTIYSGAYQENWATSGGVTAKRTLQTGASNINTGPQNDGLYIGAKLIELELLLDKQTVLDNTQSYTALNGRGNEFSVKITGSGHLGIVGKPGTPVILS